MPTLTPTRRRSLRARAHHLQPVVLIGDAGLSASVLKDIDRSLTSHELIKIKVAGEDRGARQAALDRICTALNAEPVQHIGRILVVYRESEQPSKPASRPAARPPKAPAKPARGKPAPTFTPKPAPRRRPKAPR